MDRGRLERIAEGLDRELSQDERGRCGVDGAGRTLRGGLDDRVGWTTAATWATGEPLIGDAGDVRPRLGEEVRPLHGHDLVPPDVVHDETSLRVPSRTSATPIVCASSGVRTLGHVWRRCSVRWLAR